jgi:hypothetical protein
MLASQTYPRRGKGCSHRQQTSANKFGRCQKEEEILSEESAGCKNNIKKEKSGSTLGV